MAFGSTSDRSRYPSKTTQSHRSKTANADSDRRKRSGDEAEPKRPDIDELRRRRYDYFGRPVAERRKVVSPDDQPRIPRREVVVEEYVVRRKRSKPKSSSSSSRKSSRSTRSPVQAEEYVYGKAAPAAVVVEREYEEADILQDRTPSVRSSRSKHSSSSSRQPSILEVELTPDDSISQVAERQYARPTRERAQPQRNSLPTIAERSVQDETATSARRSSKRESGLLGVLFRRKSAGNVPPARVVECLTCGSDDIPSNRAVKLACGHRMCNSCLRRIFRMAVTDQAHMPPRCCTDQHIPLEHVENLFDLKFKVLFNKKFDEYNTKNRIYCPDSRCGTWIRPSNFHTYQGRKYAQCPRCKTKACVLCSNKMHRSTECPQDPEIARLVEQAEREGWQRCYQCNAMVELKEGCNHMTCRCMAEFCMVCGSKWKTCDCPWFNYRDTADGDRLQDMRVPGPAQVVYRRIVDDPPPAPRVVSRDLPRRDDRAYARTYEEELAQRRRQERMDEDLARRMQFASVVDDDGGLPPRRRDGEDIHGIGNVAGHFMNDNFVPVEGSVRMGGFGDTAMGRRGERASGRRRERQEGQRSMDAGLVPNFLGSESLLGMAPARRVSRIPGM